MQEEEPETTAILQDDGSIKVLTAEEAKQQAANFHNTPDEKADLEKLNLRWGSAYVYRLDGRLCAHGDFNHCNTEDITHNILRLAEMRKNYNTNLSILAFF